MTEDLSNLFLDASESAPSCADSLWEPLTVADAIAAVPAWHDLAKPRRQALVSALRTSARIAETDPRTLMLSTTVMNDTVLAKPSQTYGISAASMTTIRCSLKYVMRRLGLLKPRMTLAPEWLALRQRFGERASTTLTRFIKFHDLNNVAPAAVSDASFGEFQDWVRTETLCRNTSRLFTQTRYAWNQAARKMPALDLPILGAARCRILKTIPLKAMHPELQADLQRLERHLGSSDLDDLLAETAADLDIEDGSLPPPRRPLRPITIEERLRHVRQAVWVLVRIGTDIDSVRGLRDLVVPLDRAKRIVQFMWRAAGETPSAPVGHVAEALRQIAKHYLRRPEPEVEKISRWKKQVSVEYREMTPKNRRRLEAFLAPDKRAKFLVLPEVLMAEARKLLATSRVLAVSAAKRALMIHLETFYPLRVKNLLGLREDRHLLRADLTRGPITRLFIPAEETKNRRDIDFPVLRMTSALIEEWMTKFRPLIAALGNPYLFPGIEGRPMTRQALGQSLKKIIIERVGCEVNPHLMRHGAAVSYLKKHPGEFEVVRHLLGHATDATARRFYTGPERDAAFDRFDASVLEDMRSLKPQPMPKFRRKRAPAPNRQPSAQGQQTAPNSSGQSLEGGQDEDENH